MLSRKLPDCGELRALPTLAPGELRWLVSWSSAILLLVYIPQLLASFTPPPGYLFIGNIWAPQDLSQYVAAMEEGSWLAHNRLTPEAHQPALIFPLYVAIGRLAAAIGWNELYIYQALSFLSRVALLVSIYYFVAAFLSRTRDRRIAFLLIVFSSGLTIWLALLNTFLGLPVTFNDPKNELNIPEASTFLVLFTYPHLMLALALLLLILRMFLIYAGQSRLLYLALMIASTIVLALVNPFSLVTLDAVLGAYLLVALATRRQMSASRLLAVGVVVMSTLPFLLYNFLTFTIDPFWSGTYSQQNPMPSPSPLRFVSNYGVVLVLAVIGGIRAWCSGDEGYRFLVFSALAIILVSYLPLSFQSRLALGLHPFLGVLAYLGIKRLLEIARGLDQRLPSLWQFWSLADRIAAPIGRALVILLIVGTSVLTYGLFLASSLNWLPQPSVIYEPAALSEAGRWLASHAGPNDVLLAHQRTGNYLVRWFPGRAFVAHHVATLNYRWKLEAVSEFFSPVTPEAWRRKFLSDYGVTLVAVGPWEQALGGLNTGGEDYLKPVYASGGIVIYKVAL